MPPREIQDAMSRQMSAERVRRAVVLEADGTKQANITVAEGEKEAAILRAEGEKQSAILRAQGFGEALTRIFEAARQVDEKTMTLQYLDTLKALGESPSSKFLFPLEFTRLLEGLARSPGGNGTRSE
jgi:regulator of protease activity HflC (stomatin/prohibitin superfamily)